MTSSCVKACARFLGFATALPLLALTLSAQHQPAPPSAALRRVGSITLPGVRGRIDHFSLDRRGHRLFLSALGNNTVEVMDLRTNRLLRTITGLAEPQGVTYVPASNRIFVANGATGNVNIYDGTSYRLLMTVPLGSDADDTRYDAPTGRVYVGYGEGGIAAFDAATGKLLGTIQLPRHAEAFEVENGGARIYVNVPQAAEIAVASWPQRRILASWPMTTYRANFPMALDAADHRLWVITRRPAQFLALDAATGRLVAHLPAVRDADDLWYDAARGLIYISGGAGYIDVLRRQDADHYQTVGHVATAPGARTSFFSPALSRLFVAVPRRPGHTAAVLIFATR